MTLSDVTHWHANRGTGVAHLSAAAHTVSRFEGDGSHDILANVQGHLEGDGMSLSHHLSIDVQGVENLRQLTGRKLDVDDGADNADDSPNADHLVLRLGVIVVAVMVFSLTPVGQTLQGQRRHPRSR